jgi:hypothetical protein
MKRYGTERMMTMKTKVFALTTAAVAVFATTAAAATKLAGTGCCPLCR